MNPNVSKLISYILSEVKKRGSFATKTKLLKLLYLFDVAYFRHHRTTFTGFQWKFLLYGPWAEEYDILLEGLEKEDAISTYQSDQAVFISGKTKVEPEEFVESVKDELVLRRVLDDWAEEQTNRILDFVYFNTEPMIHGTRFDPLDFSTISEELPRSYERAKSDKKRKELDQLKKEILERISQRQDCFRPKKAPRIARDDAFYEGIKALEEAG